MMVGVMSSGVTPWRACSGRLSVPLSLNVNGGPGGGENAAPGHGILRYSLSSRCSELTAVTHPGVGTGPMWWLSAAPWQRGVATVLQALRKLFRRLPTEAFGFVSSVKLCFRETTF